MTQFGGPPEHSKEGEGRVIEWLALFVHSGENVLYNDIYMISMTDYGKCWTSSWCVRLILHVSLTSDLCCTSYQCVVLLTCVSSFVFQGVCQVWYILLPACTHTAHLLVLLASEPQDTNYVVLVDATV